MRTACSILTGFLATFALAGQAAQIDGEPTLVRGEKPTVAIRLTPDPGESIKSIKARAGEAELPLEFKPFRDNSEGKISIAFLIDVSNPAKRGAQIKGEIAAVRSLLQAHPEALYEYGVFALGQEELVSIAPEGTASGRALQLLDQYKPEGLTTQGYKLTLQAIEKLAERKAPRKAVMILSDGIFEDTAYGHDGVVKKSREKGVPVFAIGYANNQDQSKYLQPLERLSEDTGGLYLRAEYDTWKLDPTFPDRFFGLLEGGGEAVIDIAALKSPGKHSVELEITDENGTFRKLGFEILLPEKGADSKAKKADGKKKPGTEVSKEGGTKTEDAAAPDEDTAGEAKTLWYVIAGAGLLVLLLAVFALVRPRGGRVVAADGDAHLTPPLAFVEMLDAQSTRYPLRISNIRIGRGRDNDLVLNNDSVSNNHCVIRQARDGTWTITDLKSGNGVFVNDQRVEETTLKEGDLIELGEVKMRFYDVS
ncbi:MAG: FHA domain-containing protein [Akkermansiaceae bacterium]|nr:FHA domain-containing protein [Akkermansiaceae bacterium]MCP5551142.1 FHA domain-containing protein [Akkermansiaceae bacterium]